MLCLGLTIAGLGPSLTIFLQNTGKDISFSKYLIFIKPLGFLLGIYSGEKLLKKFKENRILSYCFIGIFFLLITIFQINHFSLLLAFLFIFGALEGVMEVVTNSFLVALYKKKVAPYMNFMHFFFGVGAIISPTVIGRDIDINNSISNAYIFFSVFFLLGGVGFFIPFTKNKDAQPPKKTKNHSFIVLLISFVFFFYVGAEAVYTVWIFNYTTDIAAFTPEQAGYITSIFWFSFTLSRLFCTYVSRKFSSEFILFFLLIIGGGSVILFYLIFDNLYGLFTASFTLGFSFGGIFPLLLSFAEEKLNLTPLMIRSFLFFACLGAIIFSSILEPLYSLNTWFFIHLVGFCVLLLTFFFFIAFGKINSVNK